MIDGWYRHKPVSGDTAISSHAMHHKIASGTALVISRLDPVKVCIVRILLYT